MVYMLEKTFVNQELDIELVSYTLTGLKLIDLSRNDRRGGGRHFHLAKI